MKKPANDRYDGSLVRVRPKVEIGWILEGDLPDMERTAARSAAAEMKETLTLYMPQFDWIVGTIDRPSRSSRNRAEPVQLLDASEIDRDRRGWDFTIVVTARELHGREKVRALGVTAGIFATAIASTAFLKEPSSSERSVPPRLHALVMHLFGRLNGLAFEKSSTWMRRVEEASDLDTMVGFDETALKELSNRMAEVADVRVEEMAGRSPSRSSFYVRSLWQNRGALPRAFLRMRPWSFPLKLRRLTTAAGSTLVVLMMTAESWEVAINLSAAVVVLLSVVAVILTSIYLINVQHLVAGREGPLREQRAVSNAGTVAAVVAGMIVTYASVFLAGWLLAASLFVDPLLAKWTGVPSGDSAFLRVRLAALAACFSVVIGALGASFEPYGYFRHITQIDDEV